MLLFADSLKPLPQVGNFSPQVMTGWAGEAQHSLAAGGVFQRPQKRRDWLKEHVIAKIG